MNIKKYIYSGLFLGIISTGFAISVLEEDKLISHIENKVLTKFPEFNFESIKTGEFMKKFDVYVVDQFPLRAESIELKNKLMYSMGNREFRNIYTTTTRMLEKFEFNESIVKNNISNMNKISNAVGIDNTGMFIPNSIAIYDEELPSYAITDNQKNALDYIDKMYKGEYYTPYKILLENKNDYIYFRTDHHWTQLGAKLMYEDYYNKKIDLNYVKKTEDFLGTYYSKTLLKTELKDEIYSYDDLKKYDIEFDGIKSDSIYDDSKLDGKNKYQYFLNGDPGMAIISGKGEGEVIVFKDSFAHAYIPFLTQEYRKIHVLDSRYVNINIIDYIKSNKNISKIYYIYSLSTLNNEDLFYKFKNYID